MPNLLPPRPLPAAALALLAAWVTAGDASMPALLDRVAHQADPEVDIFLNDARAAAYAERLSAESDPVERLILRAQRAYELVYAGRNREAIAETESLLADARAAGAPSEAPVMRSLAELLAIAHLRLGEQENCLARHNPDACLLPIRGGGVHGLRRGAALAREDLLKLLARDPDDLGYRWLLNITAMTLGEYPESVPERWRIPPEAFASEDALPRFPDVAGERGVDVRGLAGGALLEDFDGDGDLDLMASSWGLSDPLRFFLNDGDGRFRDATEAAGLAGEVGGLNLVLGDYDGDGDADVYVLRGGWLGYLGPGEGNHPNSLLRNDGGRFVDVTREAGLLSFHPTQTAAFADYDLDGDLDLFVGNESTERDRHPCQLFRNEGDGRFRDVAAEVGLDHVGLVKGVAWGDVDGDGRPDLYLSRFGQPNRLYRNQAGRGGAVRFRDITARAGVAEPVLSFPCWFWDYDNDGDEDLFVASFASYSERALDGVVADVLGLPNRAERSRLYRNRGDGRFEDATRETGFDDVLMAMGAGFGDLDNDGFLDAYFGTGQPDLMTLVPNRMYRNDAGRGFRDVTTAGGFGHLQKGHGIVFADVDGDGDEDVYAVLGGAYSGDVFPNALFLNPGSTGRHWIGLDLRGTTANRRGVGARVRLTVETAAGLRRICRTVGAVSSFGSSPLTLHVGLGEARRVRSIEIVWPVAGRPRQVAESPALDRVLRIVQSE